MINKCTGIVFIVISNNMHRWSLSISCSEFNASERFSWIQGMNIPLSPGLLGRHSGLLIAQR